MPGEMALPEQKPHMLVFLFPGQGHINPMVEFSKSVAARGVKVTLVTTTSCRYSINLTNDCHHNPEEEPPITSNLNLEMISDGCEQGQPEALDEYIDRLRNATTQSLANLIVQIQNNSDAHVLKSVVYDSAMPWALDVARQHGLQGASFFTQSCAVNVLYHHFHHGNFKIPPSPSGDGKSDTSAAVLPKIVLPSLPPMELKDLPSFLYNVGHASSTVSAYSNFLLDFVIGQFSNFHQAKWILFNTFDELEHDVVKWMEGQEWPVKTIGPTIPATLLDKKLEADEMNKDLKNWLDSKKPGSVVYVSFGSVASWEKEQMEELALGLKNSNHNFLWVVRDSEKEKLPANFIEEIEKAGGLVVSWCLQLQVLSHEAVGCFITHCGWNSTLEALSLGVPMVAMPQFSDQITNAKFVMDVWKVGVRVKVDEGKGLVTREEIASCIREVMGQEDVRKSSLRWKELAIEAIHQGGSSYENIDEIVAQLSLT